MQGAKRKKPNVDDPDYSDLLDRLIKDKNLDFVFEEATGLGPTIAEQLTGSSLGPNHYLDVDPPCDDRHKYGIFSTSRPYPVDPDDLESYKHSPSCEGVEQQGIKEGIWLERIRTKEFSRAVMICGYLHTLSFALRLRTAEFDVKALSYMPHHKLS